MRINLEELENRINFLLNVTDEAATAKGQDIVFSIDTREEKDEWDGERTDFFITFSDDNDPNPDKVQTFFGKSCDYDDYEDLIYDIGESFIKTHLMDSYINYEEFMAYQEGYYLCVALMELHEMTGQMDGCKRVLDELVENATKAELTDAIGYTIVNEPDFNRAIDFLAQAMPNEFVGHAANAFQNLFPDYEVANGNVLTFEHSNDNEKVYDIVRAYVSRKDLPQGVVLVKELVDPLTGDEQFDFLCALCSKASRKVVKRLAKKCGIDDVMILTCLHRETYMKALESKFGDEYEHLYHDFYWLDEDDDDDDDDEHSDAPVPVSFS